MTYGFIITRHVNSEITNKYWNQCVKLIRVHYPFKQIIIIDDNSNKLFVKAEFNYKNITVINSEYPKRGELLPYIYFLQYKWFDNAIIIHDSVFIHKRIPFETFNMSVMPLWHHKYDKENLPNLLRIASVLRSNNILNTELVGKDTDMFNFSGKEYNLCFGAQCFINLRFLEQLELKYKLTNLKNVINCRIDRCAFERIIGLIFCLEVNELTKMRSLFGDIFNAPFALKYTFNDYIKDFNEKKAVQPFVKVWTGR